MSERYLTLVRLAQHLRYCTTCHDSGNFNTDLCANGARLWAEAKIPDPPHPMPREWGPGIRDNEQFEFHQEFRGAVH